MRLVYFAWLRERLDKPDETLDLPEEVTTVAELIEWMKARDEIHADVFEHSEIIQVAVDQKLVRDRSSSIKGASEIAFFPPMTGG